MTYIDLYVEELRSGYRIHGIKRGGELDIINYQHFPWFALYVESSSADKALIEIKKTDHVVGAQVIDPRERTPLLPLYKFRHTVSPNYVMIKVEVDKKEHVPQLALSLRRSISNSYAGEYNIVYPVRVSFDLDVKYFHEKCPLLFQRNDELEPLVSEVIEKSMNLKIMAFDVEVYTEAGRFPKPGNPILSIQYGVVKLCDGDFYSERWVKDNVVILESKDLRDSRDLVKEFLRAIDRERPDIIVGYNSLGFDIKYVRPFLEIPLTLVDPKHFFVNNRAYPHVDLMQARESMGSSLGVRSQKALALDDVVYEVAREVRQLKWLWTSKYYEAEEKLDHTKIAREWANRSELFENYVRADVYLTLILARLWMPTIILLSSLVQMPITELSRLNMGQVAEYNIVHWLERLGFATIVEERVAEYKKVQSLGMFSKYLENEYAELFKKGKVYVKDYGVKKHVVEGDFAQLYPTLMANETLDPLALRAWREVSTENPVEVTNYSDPIFAKSNNAFVFRIAEKRFPVLLGSNPVGKGGREKKASEHMAPHTLYYVLSTYGPVSFLLHKMLLMRRITKKFKKMAEAQDRYELLAPDQAVKILNNASYGGFSKNRGFVNEVMSAYIFWKTLKILYDVIEYAEKNLGVAVLYGDTDSIFVECKLDEAKSMFPDEKTDTVRCAKWFENHVLRKLNDYVRSKYGKEFEIKFEEAFDFCIYPKLKYGGAASKKSYICGYYTNDGGVEVEVFKGDFYKALAPEGIREKLADFYAEVIRRMPKTPEGVEKIMKDFLRNAPAYKLFVKKTVDSFESESEDEREEEKKYAVKLKKLNKPFHYAALHLAFAWNLPGVTVYKVNERKNGVVEVSYHVDARRVFTTGSIQVFFLPGSDPTEFTVYIDERDSKIVVHKVKVEEVEPTEQTESNKVSVETGYKVTERYIEEELTKEELLDLAVKAMRRYIVDDISRKLLPALHKERGGALVDFMRRVELK